MLIHRIDSHVALGTYLKIGGRDKVTLISSITDSKVTINCSSQPFTTPSIAFWALVSRNQRCEEGTEETSPTLRSVLGVL